MPTPAKSAMLQLIQGNPNRRTKEQLNKRVENEKKLQMRAENVKPPAWLPTAAKKEFKRLAELLLEVELINEADIDHLALFCDAYAQYIQYTKEIKSMGLWVDGKSNPLIMRKKDAAAQMRSFGADLGLSPSARAKLAIKLNGDDRDDDEDDF
ncbi:phage terminase small subunit P27 family [Sporolactobacillus shoreae]|uniref:Phage terminase small subunit P27 family n=1 Tax=Sporolactobacillus shoreae TaxID=1465501 RepID=A0A4Z0GHW2_9BACL|nr:phage terminase small subunit P27 family [Sporolactobacillus shoreae]TGA95622.1 phage terminase small subunit P27 family [Sporolactobacillus shoreae]